MARDLLSQDRAARLTDTHKHTTRARARARMRAAPVWTSRVPVAIGLCRHSPASTLAPPLSSLTQAGYTDQVRIAMDVAASEFAVGEIGAGKRPGYDLAKKQPGSNGSGVVTGEQLQALYEGYLKKYPIVSIEDPFEQEDWGCTKSLTTAVGAATQVVGDDILVTNPVRVKRAIEDKTCNALLLKVNQIGSVTEAIEAVNMAQKAGWGVMTSHRSGETEDTFIADLAVGLATRQIKTGAPCRSERLAKYNQLLRIEEELEGKGVFPGANFRRE